MFAAEKLLVVFCIIIVQCTVIAQRAQLIELKSFNCYNYAPEWFKSVSCELTQRNQTSYINAHLMLQKPAPRFNVRIVLEYFTATGTPVKLLDKNINFCEYLKQTTQENQFKIIHKYLKKFVNKIPICPLEENFNYTIRELNMDMNDFPSYTPDYTFRITFYVSEMINTAVVFKSVVDGKLRHSIKINGK